MSNRWRFYYAIVIALVAVFSWVALILPFRGQLRPSDLQVGQVADADYLAPKSMTYTSQALTEQKRKDAENSIAPIYTAPDTNVARRQSENLRAALAYITSVRADNYANPNQKMSDLAQMDNLRLDTNTTLDILALNETRWQAIGQEANLVLERMMSSTIQPENLGEIKERAPSLVSLSLSESDAAITAKLAAAFVAPNSFYSEALTNTARQSAREAVKPVTRSYMEGQTIVRRGQVLSDLDIEALQQLGLVKPSIQWQVLVGAAALVLLMIVYMVFYFNRDQALLSKPRRLTLIAALFVVFLFLARLVIPYHVIIPYAFPLAAYSLTVVALFGPQLAMVSSLPLAVMTAYALPNALDLTLYYLIASLLGVLALGRARRMSSFFSAGATVAIAGILVVIAYRLIQPIFDLPGLAVLSGVSVFNGLATASLTILLQFFLAQLLGITTPMQLMDLSRPDHPLLQRLLREAAGTYQHSLQVANLAEQAAERIGADPLLTRVGALYHDAGKLSNPFFFIENQLPGFANPHDSLEPAVSAQGIIRHVSDGLVIARKYGLPKPMLDFISEHHGTTLTRYQYIKAVKAAGGDENKVNQDDFRYPGPRPQSRETAILMLADGSEARVRAERPKEEDDLRALIKKVVDERVATGQLDDTNLTLQDLNELIESFTATLRGMYHPRIIYPQLETPAASDVLTRPSNQPARLPGKVKEEKRTTPIETPNRIN